MDWASEGWEAIITKAKTENKLIFLDIYTIWCGPCLKMDKDVWIEPSVQESYNESFINVKVNAENPSRGAAIAERYGATSFPTLVYLDPDGSVISTYVGGKNRYEMLELAQKVQDLYHHKAFLDKVKANIYGTYSHDELARILDITLDHEFVGKEHLAMKYLDGVTTIGEDDIRRVMPEVSRMDVTYLERLAPLTATVSFSEMYLRRNSKEWINWRNGTERAVYHFLKKYQDENNQAGYEQTLEILKGIEGVKPRKIDNLYLDFYRQNNLDQYRVFAMYLIDEYIIPTRPEDVKKADEEKYKMLREEISKDMMASLGTDMSNQASATSSTPTIDSLSVIYTISQSIADQLFEISGDFFAFYEDESSQRKASFWAELATKYYPYDWKYYDNLIFILESNGNHDKAKAALAHAKTLPWYSEMRTPSSGP